MRSDISIRADGLGKSYRIGTRATASSLVYGLSARIRHPVHDTRELFWALEDVSFEVCRGEVVGIVGRNGSGKSTLLKILSRITEPTAGTADLFGRVGCLLEVGTGFHQELTGLENIFLNGAILGMKKSEIRSRLDEIVEFSGIERFLNTPVKRYSSGMYVRLAFAVAAHLDPEILVVDEVLAVGDIEFQRKCLGKMESVAAESGRTVLFVSHNSSTVKSLCSRGMVLGRGHLLFDGDVDGALDFYSKTFEDHMVGEGTFALDDRLNPMGSAWPLTLSRLAIEGEDGPTGLLRPGGLARFSIFTVPGTSVPNPFYRINLRNNLDQNVVATDSRMTAVQVTDAGAIFEIESLPLLPGTYYVDVGMGSGRGRHVLDYVIDAGRFEVRGDVPFVAGYEVIPEDGNVIVPPLWSSVGDRASRPNGSVES